VLGVWIDPIKLAANNLTIQEVEGALRSEKCQFTRWNIRS
jgi:multidrug efflux pump subunit AcrB